MDLIGALGALGLPEYALIILITLVVLHMTGSLKAIQEGVRTLFNRTYASEQQTIKMNDRLFNIFIDSHVKLQDELKEARRDIDTIKDHIVKQTEVESDIDLFMHELDQKHAATIRLLQSLARDFRRDKPD